MKVSFSIIPKEKIEVIIPLVQQLTNQKHSDEILLERFTEMTNQNYECVGVYSDDVLIGCCGLWFMTRHYAGRSCEPDHVFIESSYRNNGIGKQLFNWVYQYAKEKGCTSCELNTYVQNYPSHKFLLQ